MVMNTSETHIKKKTDMAILNTLTKRMAEQTLPYLQQGWKMQNNEEDAKTNFIYQMDGVDDILYEHKKNPNFDLGYAIQRYYNFLTSTHIESIFCSYEGCEPERNKQNKEVDFWVFDTPFDLKVTSFPKRFEHSKKDFANDRAYRNELIKWFYEKQSKGQRNLNQNRLFLVCQDGDGKDSLKNQMLKMEFHQIDDLAGKFMDYHLKRKNEEKDPVFNEVEIDGKQVLSDIIFLKK